MTVPSRRRLAGDSLDWKEKGEGAYPPVFWERVRKLLIGKKLLKHSFLKSAEEYENEGFIFSRFLQKSEKSARGSGFRSRDGTVALWNWDFNAEGTEFAELRRRKADPSLRSGWQAGGNGEWAGCEANISECSMDSCYCQGLLLLSIVRMGSGKSRRLKEFDGSKWLVYGVERKTESARMEHPPEAYLDCLYADSV